MAKKGRHLVKAKDVIKDPLLLDSYSEPHLLLHDSSMSTHFENMLTVLDRIVPQGWQIIGMSTNYNGAGAIDMYVLLRRAPAPAPGEVWPSVG